MNDVANKDRDATLKRRRKLAVAAAVGTATLAASAARAQVCLSIMEPEPPPCAEFERPNPTSLIYVAECHAKEGKLDKALELYERFLSVTQGDAKLEHERARVEWTIRRIKLLQGDKDVFREPEPMPAQPETSTSAQPEGVEVVVPDAAPNSGGAASCGCRTGPRQSGGGLWIGALAFAAWIRRRLMMMCLFLVACRPTPAVVEPSQDPVDDVATEVDSAAAQPPDGLTTPVILRCPRSGCQMLARVRRADGAVERLKAYVPHGSPVLVDDNNVYWAGGAARKSDLLRVELNWRSQQKRYIEQDAQALIVTDEIGVYVLPKDGSPRRVLASGPSFWSAAKSPTFVAWATDSGRVREGDVVVAGPGGQIKRTVAGEIAPYGTRIFDGVLFWYNFGSGGAHNPNGAIRAMRDGKAVTLAGGQHIPRDLTVSDGYVYWVTDVEEGRIARRIALAGGKIERLGVSHEIHGVRRNEDRIVVHGPHVYWNAGHSIVRVPRAGGKARIVITADIPGDIVSFAVDAQHVYVAADIFRKGR